jgi:RNA-binding proteins (RRM domain)
MKLFVRNIAWEATEEVFRKWLTNAQGYQVTNVRIIVSPETGKSRGFGFMVFATEAAGREALHNLNEKEFMGRTLYVEEAVERERGSSRKRNSGSRGQRARRGDDVSRVGSDSRRSIDGTDWED